MYSVCMHVFLTLGCTVTCVDYPRPPSSGLGSFGISLTLPEMIAVTDWTFLCAHFHTVFCRVSMH